MNRSSEVDDVNSFCGTCQIKRFGGGLMFAGTAAAQQDNTSGAGAGKVDPGHPRVNQVNSANRTSRTASPTA
jgi:hypothetical protein